MSDKAHKLRSLQSKLPVKFLAGILMGLIVEGLLFPFHVLEPVRALQYLGEDIVFSSVSRSNLHMSAAAHDYVFVNIDDASLQSWDKSPGADIRPEIIKLLTELRQSKASLVVVDIIFGLREGVRNPLYEIMAMAGRPLVAVAETQAPDVSMPMSMARLGSNYRYLAKDTLEGLTLATPDLGLIGGKARERVTVDCLDDGVREIALPGIAEAVRKVLSLKTDGGEHKTKSRSDEVAHDCNKKAKEETRIIFLQPYVPSYITPLQGHLTEISASNVTDALPELADKIVVVGQTHRATTDWFDTSFGWMPGVFVHLNSIMSDQVLNGAREASFSQELVLLLIIIFAVSAIYLPYWVIHEVWIEDLPIERSRRGFIFFILDLLIFLAFTGVAVFSVFEIVKWEGTDLLLRGVIVGTLVPAVAVILEAAFELGGPAMFWLEELAKLLVVPLRWVCEFFQRAKKSKGPGGAAVLVLMLLGARSAFAADQAVDRLYPDPGSSLADFTVDRGQNQPRRLDASGELLVGDVVRAIRKGAAASVKSIVGRETVARVTYDNPIKIVEHLTPDVGPPGRTNPGASTASSAPLNTPRAAGMGSASGMGSAAGTGSTSEMGSASIAH
jgi:hypothetical protein